MKKPPDSDEGISHERKRTQWILGAVGLMVMVAVGSAVYSARDIPPQDYGDLALPERKINSAENAYDSLKETMALFRDSGMASITEYLAGRTTDPAKLKAVLDDNRAMLESLKTCSDFGYLAFPRVTSPMQGDSGEVLQCKLIFDVAAARIRHDRLAGLHGDAVEECADLLRVSNLIMKDSENIITYLVGVSACNLTLKQAEEIIRDPATSDAQLKQLQKTLATMGLHDDALVRALMVEFSYFHETVAAIRSGALDHRHLSSTGGASDFKGIAKGWMDQRRLKANKTAMLHARLTRELIRKVPLDAATAAALPPLPYDPGIGPEVLARGNKFGVQLTEAYGRFDFLTRKRQLDARLAAVRLLAACRAHRRETGSLPAGLASLVPRYIDKVPVDPFDGKPFRYSPSAGTLWSVGSDGTDQGGSKGIGGGVAGTNPDQMPDMVFDFESGP